MSSRSSLSILSSPPDDIDTWILGSSLPSLTAAVHLIQEAQHSAFSHGIAPWNSVVASVTHDLHGLNHPRSLDRGPFNRHEAITVPVVQFLQSQESDFQFHTTVTDILLYPDSHHVTAIRTHTSQTECTITLRKQDIVVVSLGSVLSGATTGSNFVPPSLDLMEDPRFRNAYNFCTRADEFCLESFTVTLHNPQFFSVFIALTVNSPSLVFVTLQDANWLLKGIRATARQKRRNIDKTMLECSGEENMTELPCHLKFPLQDIIPHSTTVPCVVSRMSTSLLVRALQIDHSSSLTECPTWRASVNSLRSRMRPSLRWTMAFGVFNGQSRDFWCLIGSGGSRRGIR
ncbi:uncharacterized protein ATNIH1004_003044 [Aspergillus tanneri]|uniref:Uncharacterized protein n=1 Tax=Aspergillus tanneri TaxID=1220188 RepID=A0A5M9MYB8_9EURO|nr:uncharacterized protein ATNIH1004_003044 [Aspergillus tanneri]KAA8650360.1 hypothetical protein ATNIH1004_003044 [Aspergillus tanneri]